MSRDQGNEYFSDGLAEEIINELVRIPGLKVIARTSAFAFKGKTRTSAGSPKRWVSPTFSKAACGGRVIASA